MPDDDGDWGERYTVDVDVDDLDHIDRVDTAETSSGSGVDVAGFLAGERSREVERVRQQIQEVKAAIGRREEIEERRLELLYDEIRHVEEQLRTLSMGDAAAERSERKRLKEDLRELKMQVIDEPWQAWQNRQPLEEELRSLERELEELLDSDVVDEFVEDGGGG